MTSLGNCGQRRTRGVQTGEMVLFVFTELRHVEMAELVLQ